MEIATSIGGTYFPLTDGKTVYIEGRKNGRKEEIKIIEEEKRDRSHHQPSI